MKNEILSFLSKNYDPAGLSKQKDCVEWLGFVCPAVAPHGRKKEFFFSVYSFH